jgi:ornithine cyclodeaminase
MSASVLTAIRTAAASALATRYLAKADAHVLTIVGTGEEARTHIDAVTAVRPIDEVRVWGRTPARAQKLAERFRNSDRFEVRPVENLREAMRGADIVCTVTAAAEPIVAGGWLEPGMHLNVAGSGWAHKAEVDPECVRRSRVFVDYRASALAQAGELIQAFEAGAVTEDHIRGEIGQVIMQAVPGRTHPQDITMYKSVGIIAQDLAPAWYLYSLARERNSGARLHL